MAPPDKAEQLKLNASITPGVELSQFIEGGGTLSGITRGDRQGQKRDKKVTPHNGGKLFSQLGLEYIKSSNETALIVQSQREEISRLTDKVIAMENSCLEYANEKSELVRSLADLRSEYTREKRSLERSYDGLRIERETEKNALERSISDLQIEFNNEKTRSHRLSSALLSANDQIRVLNANLAEQAAECARLRQQNSALQTDIEMATIEVDLQKGLYDEMAESEKRVVESEKRVVESEKRREEETFAKHMENVQTRESLRKVESEKRKLERKLERVITPSTTPLGLIGSTPKRKVPRSVSLDTQRLTRKAFSYLDRGQKRERAGRALAAIDLAVRPDLEPAIDNISIESDLCSMPKENREHLSLHYKDMLDVMIKNHKNHPFVLEMERREKGGKGVMTAWEAVSVAAQSDLSNRQVRKLKKALLDRGASDPFGSTREFNYLRDILDIGRHLVGTHIECKGRKVPAMGIAYPKLRVILSGLCRDLFGVGTLKGDEVRILNIGDGGGGVCKLGFSFVDVPNPLSEKNLLPYLVFLGSDEWEELRTIAMGWAKELNKIKTLSFELEGNTKTVRVEWFAGGDCKYLAAIYGLKNASARDPCPFCYTDKQKKCIANRFVPMVRRQPSQLKLIIPRRRRFTIANARTLRSYMYDAKYGTKSVKGKPLFLIKVENCAPPGLHAIQGAFDTLIEVVAMRFAINEYLIGKGLRPLKRALGKAISLKTRSLKKRERALKEMEMTLADINVSINLLESSVNGTLVTDNTNKGRCGDRCLISVRANHSKVTKENRLKLKCGLCQNYIHLFCDDIFSPSDRAVALEEARNEYTCKDCDHRGISSVVRLSAVNERKIGLEKEISTLKRKIAKRSTYLTTLRELKEENGGEPARLLERAVKEAGADKQAWFQKYTGNHVRKVLRARPESEKSGPEIICGIFDETKTPLAPVLHEALTLLGEMQAASVARDLSSAEIEQFKEYKDRFFDCLAQLEPNCSMRLKLHILDQHVYPFMKKHGTWGRFLEQAIESKHARWNKKARMYCSTKTQLFVHWKTIMADMFIETLNHINPNRDYSQLIAEYKRVIASKKKWSDIHGERVVKQAELPDQSDDDSDVDIFETPIYDEYEGPSISMPRRRLSEEMMEFD